MPPDSGWNPLLNEWVEKENDCYGVYYLGDEGSRTLYIGVGHVLTGLRSHLQETAVKEATRYRVDYAGTLKQAKEHYKTTLNKFSDSHGSPPPYNHAVKRRSPGKAAKRVT